MKIIIIWLRQENYLSIDINFIFYLIPGIREACLYCMLDVFLNDEIQGLKRLNNGIDLRMHRVKPPWNVNYRSDVQSYQRIDFILEYTSRYINYAIMYS